MENPNRKKNHGAARTEEFSLCRDGVQKLISSKFAKKKRLIEVITKSLFTLTKHKIVKFRMKNDGEESLRG